jgi:hypothetical protein
MDIRNLDGKLVCRLNRKSGVLEIRRKGCKTLLRVRPQAIVLVKNTRVR